MKTEQFRKIEDANLEMGEKAKKDYIENGGLANLRGAATAYNTAIRAAIAELMYKNQKKNESNS
jgi:hypothetical protein